MLVCIGVIGLGIVEAHEDDELRAARQQAANRRYAKSALAIILPVLYCVLDALGTFADSRVLETLDEDSANCAYELTFLVAAVICFIYVVIIKRQKLVPAAKRRSTPALSLRRRASSPISMPSRTRGTSPSPRR